MNYMEKNCLLQNSCSGALRRVDEKSHHLLRTPFSAPLNIGACHEQAPNLSEGRVEWRRERDSNPRSAKRTIAFEATAFNPSAISPDNNV